MTQVVISREVPVLIEQAERGDYTALSQLYAMTATLLESRGRIPEPLLAFMRPRLLAIAAHLGKSKQDYARGALHAITGTSKPGRKGFKKDVVEAFLAAEVYLEMRTSKNREEAIAKVAAAQRIDETTVKRAYESEKRSGRLTP